MEQKKPAYSAELLWVNHDSKNMNALPNRQKVSSHIQRHYRSWKRKASAQELRNSKFLTNRALRSSGHELARSNVSDTRNDTSDETQAASQSAQFHASVTRRFRGNSDPFDAQAVRVCPRVNDILKFYRDYAIPSQYHTGPDGWKTTAAAMDDWKDAVQSLHERGGALGFLARWAQVASNVTQSSELAVEALRFRSQSTTILHEKLKRESGTISKSTYWHMHTLYTAETLAGNPRAAWLHATIMQQVLRQHSEKGQMELTYLRYFLYNESSACCMFMTRPVLDYETWVPQMFKPAWRQAGEELASLKIEYNTMLDPSIECWFLKNMFLLQREDLEVWRHASSRAEDLSPSMFIWFAARHSIHQARLVKYALDRADEARSEEKLGMKYFKNAYLALTVVYWTRLIAGSDTIMGVEIFATKRPLLKAIRELLDEEEAAIGLDAAFGNKNARLWALYVGAQAEQQLPSDAEDNSNNTWGTKWFSEAFSLHAARMNLLSWTSVQSVLDGFLDYNITEPHGEEFAPRLLRPLDPVAG